ncbi:MAG TPA: hypothetical protein VFH68_18360 [Polyangia bacterium]|jgi:hypothetical protein|nr:hypothetical protein [Polyangia bacterium]
MTGPDPSHWLHRLTAEEWLAAADTELLHCEETLGRRAVRAGVTHARRAAGMAWNALLALARAPDAKFGRSYMDHVVALAGDDGAPEEIRAAARVLRETPAAPPALIAIGKPDLTVLDQARRIVDHVRERVAAGRVDRTPPQGLPSP